MKTCKLYLSMLTLAATTSFTAPSASAQEKEATAQVVGVPAASVPKSRPITVTVELIGGQKINGTLTDMTLLPIRASFGQVDVGLSEVAGIKLASAEDTTTTIIMTNGDSITCATDLKIVTVDTEWGSAKINGSSITSILFLPDLKWNGTMGLNGKRWSLVDSKPTAASGTPGQPGNVLSNQPGTTVRTTPGTSIPSGSRIVPN
jgi:hypothetical protein